jgi:hypothetical protein
MGFHTLVCILTALAFHYSRTTGLRESRWWRNCLIGMTIEMADGSEEEKACHQGK